MACEPERGLSHGPSARAGADRSRSAHRFAAGRPNLSLIERVVILGPAGAGKSALAAELSRRTKLPIVHLDRLFWRAGWTPAPREQASRDLRDAIAAERWILDGNFLRETDGAEDARFERADTVIFLDAPRRTCFWRLLKRLVRDHGRSRPDLPEGCTEGFDVPLLRWVWSYPRTDRPRVLALLSGLDDRVQVHRLRSRSDVQRLLAGL